MVEKPEESFGKGGYASDIDAILQGYMSAAQRAREAGFDLIEIQCGHGYLISQFLNSKLNKREDQYGQDRLLFAKEALSRVRDGCSDMPLIIRISGSEMSPDFGLSREDMLPLLKMAEEVGICALHVGMGNACFSPPWYFHHGSLSEDPQIDALSWLRKQTSLPLIAAGRMGRREKVERILEDNLAHLIALGRPFAAARSSHSNAHALSLCSPSIHARAITSCAPACPSRAARSSSFFASAGSVCSLQSAAW